MRHVNDSSPPIKGAQGKIRSGAKRKLIGARRRYKRAFDFNPTRRSEIERHVRHVGAADSDDFDRWLLAWCWHNPKASDLRWSLQNWSTTKFGRELTDDELDTILDDVENKRTRRRMSADNLGRWLGLTYEVRKALAIRPLDRWMCRGGSGRSFAVARTASTRRRSVAPVVPDHTRNLYREPNHGGS
jgi:hypothetical protein